MFVGAALALAVGRECAGHDQLLASDRTARPRSGMSPIGRAPQDACQKAVDMFQFMTPQLGLALAGGNATLGQGGALGGSRPLLDRRARQRFRAACRRLRTRPSASITGAAHERPTIRATTQVVGLPAVEARVGIFGGVPLGLTQRRRLDLLVSATYVPSVDEQRRRAIAPDGSLKLGYGGALGLLQESFASPGVSLTYLKRDLPTDEHRRDVSGG